ncbi:hypothetical protein [Planctomicrobium sp. SH527]|uniref:hypothetical protein n=1 Tax=Planctomicrobium sp. SH527 TaxID=3448123 RepID=UPI003F5B911E
MSDRFEIEPEPRPKSGMSGWLKLLIGFGIASTIGAAICCGLGVWFFTQNMKFTQEPEKIIAQTNEIVSIQLPAEYKPEIGMQMSLGMKMNVVAYSKKPAGTLALVQVTVPGQLDGDNPMTEEQMKQSMEQQLEKQGQRDKIDITARESRKIEVDGVERTFEFITGTDPKSKNEVKQVQGMFPGRDGTAFLMITEGAAEYNEEEIINIIKSISTKKE